ncbi:MAG TPA: DUF982 domain-containing protein [Devosia sp.]|nr:DUF982 domain-containing protein [Devosia sp.]
MNDQQFSEPIFLVLSGLGNFRADSAWECFEYLDLHWPAARTSDYRRAKALCRVAIDGGVPAEQARRAVVALARRSGLLAGGPGSITGKVPPSYRLARRRASAGPLTPRTVAALGAGKPYGPPAGGVTLR